MPDNCPILEAHGIRLDDLKGGKEICLNCPLYPEKCIYDEQGGARHYRKKLRDRELIRLFTIEGKRIRELAPIFNITPRTAQRVIKEYRRLMRAQ